VILDGQVLVVRHRVVGRIYNREDLLSILNIRQC